MRPSRALRFAVAPLLVVCLAIACRRAADPGTPEEAKARGDELLRRTGDTLKAAHALSFDTSERHERVRRNGEKRTYTLTRAVRLRRPDRLWYHASGTEGRDLEFFYDGRALTLLGKVDKVYARAGVPSSVDGMLDRVGERFDVPVPMGDVLHSDPYSSFAGKEFTGGWVKRVTIEDRPCHELTYRSEAVDFTLWTAADDAGLPCELAIVYKGRPGQPTSRMTFRNWNLNPTLSDEQFTAAVPKGYEQIPILERIPKDELKADAAKAMGVAPAAGGR